MTLTEVHAVVEQAIATLMALLINCLPRLVMTLRGPLVVGWALSTTVASCWNATSDRCEAANPKHPGHVARR